MIADPCINKTLIFIRGLPSELRSHTVSKLMRHLNNSVNSVTGNKVTIPLFGNKEQNSIASRDAKNQIKKMLVNPVQDEYIVIDALNIKPTYWNTYINIAKKLHITPTLVGIDIENIVHYPEYDLAFKQDMYIYHYVTSGSDLQAIFTSFKK